MASQTHYYPCNETKSSLCTTCNSGLNPPDGIKGTNGTNGSKNNSPSRGGSGSPNRIACSAFCNVSCNSKYCQSSQAYCNISHELIINHGDIGAYPIPEVCGSTSGEIDPKKYTIIREAWSATNWNKLIDKLEMAEIVGKKNN